MTGGYQQNNISKLKQNTDLRKIGSVNISYFTTTGFSTVLSYSNYQSDQSAGYIKVEDSLKLALVNEMALFAPSFNWEGQKFNHTINLNISYQKFLDINQHHKVKLVNDYNYNASIDYSISIPEKNLNLNIGNNYFLLLSEGNDNTQVGISLGVSNRMLEKKLLNRISLSWNKNFYNKASDGFTANLRVRSSYKITKKQQLGLNVYWLNRTGEHRRNINELRASMNYSLSF